MILAINIDRTVCKNDSRALDSGSILFNTTNLRKRRRRAEAKWTAGFDSEEDKKGDMDALYSAYHSQTARNYFMGKGLLNQGKDPLCRTLRQGFITRNPGATRSDIVYMLKLPEGVIAKEYPWWVLFLQQEHGPQLDKFIRNALLGGTWCHISHKCYWAFCLNSSHLEQVLKPVNDDRSVCKNRSRDNDGGCNALHSLHPHNHCLLPTHMAPHSMTNYHCGY